MLIYLQRMLCSRVMAGMVRGGRRGLATTSKKAASYSVQVGCDWLRQLPKIKYSSLSRMRRTSKPGCLPVRYFSHMIL